MIKIVNCETQEEVALMGGRYTENNVRRLAQEQGIVTALYPMANGVVAYYGDGRVLGFTSVEGKRGRKKGSGSTPVRPQISELASAYDTLQFLRKEAYLDANDKLTEKGRAWVKYKLKSLGMSNIILFEAYFAEAYHTDVDYSDVEATGSKH